MRYILPATITITLLIMLLPVVRAAEEIRWHDYEEALLIARKDNKFVLLYFRTSGCPYCRLMEISTFRDPEVVRILNKGFIPVMISASRRPDLVTKFGIMGVPSIVILDSKGKVLRLIVGYRTPSELAEELKSVLARRQTDRGRGYAVPLHLMLMSSYLAGVFTLFTPCILPILPLYVLAVVKSGGGRRLGLYLVGLMVSFVLMGFIAGLGGGLIGPHVTYAKIMASILVILFGLSMITPQLRYLWSMLGSITSPIWGTIAKSQRGGLKWLIAGLLSSVLWISCVGPLLGAVLTYIAMSAGPLEGSFVMLSYGAGLASSMLMVGLLFRGGTISARSLARRMKSLERITGIAFIIYGVLMLLGIDELIIQALSG